MAVWRQKAIELFPQLRDLNSGEYTIYSLFTDLRGELEQAHEANDADALDRLYSFAEWCLRQKDLNNSAAVAFYEHLFELKQAHWPAIIRRLSPQVVQEVCPLWEWLLSADRFRELQKRLEAQGKAVARPRQGVTRGRPKR